MKKKQPHREGFVPDTAVLISVYYVRSDSAAPDQIMATLLSIAVPAQTLRFRSFRLLYR